LALKCSRTLLDCRERPLGSVAFSPDGKTLAAGYLNSPTTRNGGVVLWDVPGGKRLVEKALPVAEGAVTSVGFSPDGETLAAGFAYAHGLYIEGGVVLRDVASHKRMIQAPCQ